MLPIISGGHSAYQDTFVSDFIAIYPDPFALSKSIWKTIIEFWYLDLSLTDYLLMDSYSKFGPAPRQPSCMLLLPALYQAKNHFYYPVVFKAERMSFIRYSQRIPCE